jgi:putative endonuclease
VKRPSLVAAVAGFFARLWPSRSGGAFDAGRWGEQVAAKWLSRHGYQILGRRVRPNRRDELDLVVHGGGHYVFVEVKTRRSERFGRPAAAVNARKRHALCRAAAAYLRKAGYPRGCYRFDVVEVIGEPGLADPVVRHIEDAFRFEPRYRFPVGASS